MILLLLKLSNMSETYNVEAIAIPIQKLIVSMGSLLSSRAVIPPYLNISGFDIGARLKERSLMLKF